MGHSENAGRNKKRAMVTELRNYGEVKEKLSGLRKEMTASHYIIRKMIEEDSQSLEQLQAGRDGKTPSGAASLTDKQVKGYGLLLDQGERASDHVNKTLSMLDEFEGTLAEEPDNKPLSPMVRDNTKAILDVFREDIEAEKGTIEGLSSLRKDIRDGKGVANEAKSPDDSEYGM